MKYAIRSGVGIGLMPEYLAEEETDLVPVLNDVNLPTMPVHFRLSGRAQDVEKDPGSEGFSRVPGQEIQVLTQPSRWIKT